MAKFTTRVELHGADEEDYDILHKAMKKRGFSRTIKNNKGKLFHLPTAEYDCQSDDIDEVLEDAKLAAGQTEKGSSILVTEAPKRRWTGLEPV
jgi:hypothetical protein